MLSFALGVWGSRHQPEAAYYLVLTRAWELLAGALAACWLTGRSSVGWRWPWVNEWASLAGLGLIAYAVFAFGPQTPFPGFHALMPIGGTLLIILACTKDTLLGKLLACRLLVGVGLISYSAYLWHQPLFAFAKSWNPQPLDSGQRLGLCGFVLALACMSWRFVEQPFRTAGTVSSRTFLRLAIAGGVGLVLFGVAGRQSGGFPGRYEADELYLATVTRADAARYVTARFTSRLLQPFEDDVSKRKVLFVGDSFAEDILNAIHEAGLDERLQISTYSIRAYCGNLYVTKERERHLARVSDPRCRGKGWNDDEQLRRLARHADEIWLASAWQDWQAGLVAETVANIRSDFGKESLVFGRKHFGKVSISHLLRLNRDERLRLSVEPDVEHLRTNQHMAHALGSRMVDVSGIMCGNSSACRLFLPDGHLISFDGAHLTQHGARELGRRLKSVGAIPSYPDTPANPTDRSRPAPTAP